MEDIFLPRVTLQQIQSMNILFSGAACTTCTIYGKEYAIVFEPSNLVHSWWGAVYATIGIEKVILFLDTLPPLESILPGVWPTESHSLPKSVVLVALNTVLENVLDELGEALGSTVVIDDIVLTVPKDAIDSDSLFFSLVDVASEYRVLCGLSFVSGAFPIAFTSRLAKLIKDTTEEATGAYTLPVVCDIVLGYSVLPYQDFSTIAVRDILFFDDYYPYTQSIAITTPEGVVYKGKWLDTTITITEEIPNEYSTGCTMEEHELNAIPVKITMDIGSVLIPMGEMRTLQNGYVFTTNQSTASPVTLRICGKKFAVGELLDVEGRIGVRLTDISMETGDRTYEEPTAMQALEHSSIENMQENTTEEDTLIEEASNNSEEDIFYE